MGCNTTYTELQFSRHNSSARTLRQSLKVKGQDTCYSTAYTSQTQEQQHFIISEVTAN